MSAVHRKKDDPAFQLLNGQAGMDVNDRCEVAKILRTQPKTIVFVFAGGRQTRDKEFVRDMLHQCHTEGSEKKKKKWRMFVFPQTDCWFLEFHLRGKETEKWALLVFYISKTMMKSG